MKCGDIFARHLKCRTAEIADHRHRRLLSPHRERPRGNTAKQRDELAADHSITSSASASSVAGTSRPSALAVFRLMTNWIFVACMTGRLGWTGAPSRSNIDGRTDELNAGPSSQPNWLGSRWTSL